jgi:proteic killer suppression protein
MAIKSFQHKGLERYFLKGSKAGIQAVHAAKLGRLLARLNVATAPEDMNVPGWGFHGLKGDLAGQYAVSVNGNWRLTFAFDGRDAVVVDYQDYH